MCKIDEITHKFAKYGKYLHLRVIFAQVALITVQHL